MRQSFLELEHQNIAVFDNGVSGPDILFIHGTSQSIETFRPQFDSPLAKMFHMVAVAMPGHPPSTPSLSPENDYSISSLVSIIVKVVKHFGIEDAVLVGHSSGGHFAVAAATQLPKLKGVMAIGSPLLENPSSMAQAFLPHPVFPLLFTPNLSIENIEKMAQALLLPEHQFATEIKTSIKNTDPAFRGNLGENIVAGNFPNEHETARSLHCPLAMVHGMKDLLVNLDYMQKLDLPTLWNSEINLIPEAGHFPSQESPEAFNQLLIDFIRYCHK
jgi:pimeloyl-ACP methyl ester carboxylesterase